jgi:hypothetical protein
MQMCGWGLMQKCAAVLLSTSRIQTSPDRCEDWGISRWGGLVWLPGRYLVIGVTWLLLAGGEAGTGHSEGVEDFCCLRVDQ